jgi:hypothetical protein
VRTNGNRRANREGLGVRLYLSTAEAESLARGEVPAALVAKVKAKLKPPAQIPGQTDILTALAEGAQRDLKT